jgi:hypothetical protein
MPTLELTKYSEEKSIELKSSFKFERKAERVKIDIDTKIKEKHKDKAISDKTYTSLKEWIMHDKTLKSRLGISEAWSPDIGFFGKKCSNKYKALQPVYLNEEEQHKYHLIIEGHTFKKMNEWSGRHEIINGRCIYVVDTKGNIIAAPAGEVKHHSFLANGKKVKAAGFLRFDKGKLIAIDNDSGHYKPTREEMIDVLFALANQLIETDIENCHFIDHSAISLGEKRTYQLAKIKESIDLQHEIFDKLEPESIEKVRAGEKRSPIDLLDYHHKISDVYDLIADGDLDEGIESIVTRLENPPELTYITVDNIQSPGLMS